MDVLVLNRSYMPMYRVSWNDAFTLLWQGRVEVLEGYEDRTIQSSPATSLETYPKALHPLRTGEDGVWMVPSVIRFLTDVVKGMFTRGVKFTRRNIWLRDRGICQYCGLNVTVKEFEFEHVIPRSHGGKTSWDNIVVGCRPCNQKKRNRTPAQAGMRLRTKPVRPKSLPGKGTLALLWGEGMPSTWKDYLGTVQYWNTTLDSD